MNGQLGWKYYNYAVIPVTMPHESAMVSELSKQNIWKENPKALFARWTTDFDCGYETNWWYVIKDTPMDLAALKAKRRYEINKGIRNFDVKRIDAMAYVDALFDITVAAYSGWPEKYRPQVKEEAFKRGLCNWCEFEVYGAISRETGKLCAYALLKKHEKWAEFNVLRADPKCEPQGINAAVVYGMLIENDGFIRNGGYICDGSRSINHETAFQDYLEKYFGFRKAYCKLHLKFRPGVGILVGCIYPFRKMLKKLDTVGVLHKINGVLTMREISLSQEKI